MHPNVLKHYNYTGGIQAQYIDGVSSRVPSYRNMAARRTRVADASRAKDGLKAVLELSSNVIGSKSRAPTTGEGERCAQGGGLEHEASILHIHIKHLEEVLKLTGTAHYTPDISTALLVDALPAHGLMCKYSTDWHVQK